MILKLTLTINLLWAIIMIAAHGFLVFFGFSNIKAVVFSLTVIYGVIALFALKKKPWARIVCFIVSALLTIYWLLMVLMNFWLYFTDAPLYLDSPGTILIVAILSVVYLIPATVITLGFIVHSFPMVWNKIRNKVVGRCA